MTRIHLSFPTRDLQASVRFYEVLFDVGPDKVHDDHVRFQPAEVPIALALMPGAPVTSGEHLGVKLTSTEQVQAAIARFREAGVEHRVEDATTCCYAGMDRVWVADPDGRPWEVYVVTDDAIDGNDRNGCCEVDATPEEAEGSNGDAGAPRASACCG